MNRQDFDTAVKNEFLEHHNVESSIASGTYRFGLFKHGSDAAYNLLSKEISEKDAVALALNDEIKEYCRSMEKQKQEIERLKGLIEEIFHKYGIGYIGRGTTLDQFKKDNQL